MDFDWADETMHAGYGKHWLKELLSVRGQDPAAYDQVRERCEKLVRDYVATATPHEVAQLKEAASALIAKARQMLAQASSAERSSAIASTAGHIMFLLLP